MAQYCWIAISVLVTSCLLTGVSCRPQENEALTPVYTPEAALKPIVIETARDNEENYVLNEPTEEVAEPDNTQDILEKIKRINERLSRPERQQINYNNHDPDKSYVLDEETLKKLQVLISTGKLQELSGTVYHENMNPSSNENTNFLRSGRPRSLYNRLSPTSLASQGAVAFVPYPYPYPMAVTPYPELYGAYQPINNNDLNSIEASKNPYLTRQNPPSLPFQIQWPLASYFPLLVRDPFITFLQSGNFNNLFEYGQSADVCSRKQKSSETTKENDDLEKLENKVEVQDKNVINNLKLFLAESNQNSLRKGRAIKNIKKRTIQNSPPQQELNNKVTKISKKIFGNKNKIITKKPVPQPIYGEEEDIEDTKGPGLNDGDLRFPFSDFTWFGNRKPVAPSPGFFINRLKVRRGGVAIAGPGGVATAGRGGTAIVGPGGLAYTQPGGMAVAGPAAKVFALSPDADLTHLVSQLQKKTTKDGTDPRSQIYPEGKLVATGPVIYYHEPELN